MSETEETKPQTPTELSEKQLDNVAGAGILGRIGKMFGGLGKLKGPGSGGGSGS